MDKEPIHCNITFGSVTVCGVIERGKEKWIGHGGVIMKSKSQAESYARALDYTLSEKRPRVVRSKQVKNEYDYYSSK